MLCSTAGALCITSPSRDVVEMVASWGSVLGSEKAFRPDDCWALRRGKVHRVKDPASPLRCAHVSKSLANGYVCVPLAAQGETLGVLYVENFPEPAGATAEPGFDQAEVLERQATAVGERISLALANLRLREVLRGQSIRDPLTGLFNRRFMEESLERELRRALRGKQQLALLMLDIDHFKRFNDTFGHQAGDALLRALGNLLKESTRGQDVVCRYGGEEFAFVLAGASLEAARKRADLLREDIKQLSVQHGGQLLGAVTLSIGIAVFPDNGDNAENLLKAADDALYRAKKEGRDRIILAQ
jgi:diguanylate cyclase (GGDEF)-like protein